MSQVSGHIGVGGGGQLEAKMYVVLSSHWFPALQRAGDKAAGGEEPAGGAPGPGTLPRGGGETH